MKVDISGRECTYTCETLDEGMPLHSHQGGAQHYTRCDRGSVVVFIEPDRVHTLKAGSLLRFDSTIPHGIYPLEPGSRFTNVCKEEHAEFHGEMQMSHMAPEWATRTVPRAASRVPR